VQELTDIFEHEIPEWSAQAVMLGAPPKHGAPTGLLGAFHPPQSRRTSAQMRTASAMIA
jgi:hypothetical protein